MKKYIKVSIEFLLTGEDSVSVRSRHDGISETQDGAISDAWKNLSADLFGRQLITSVNKIEINGFSIVELTSKED